MIPLSEIEIMDRSALLDVWSKLFGGDAPKGISEQFLRRFLAYELQTRAAGGVPRAVQRLQEKCCPASSTTQQPQLGTRFIREWQGRTHVVEKIEAGYRWNEQIYTSLSAVARAITGARWSGPRFFGLTKDA